MSSRSTQSVSGSSSGNRSPQVRDVEQQSYLQQQRLESYMAQPFKDGNRLVGLSYRTAATETSTFSQGESSLVEQPYDLRGVGSWTASQGSKR